MYKRVIVKLSGEALAGGQKEDLYSVSVVNSCIAQFVKLHDEGVKFAIVFGGGNIWRGNQDTSGIDKPASHEIGMLASTINAMFMAQKMKLAGLNAVVYTPFSVGGMTKLYSREDASADFENGVIPIFAGGTGLPYFSTDMITAVRGLELHVDAIIYTKDYCKDITVDTSHISGVYDKDPIKCNEAVHIPRVTYKEMVERTLSVIDVASSAYLNAAGETIDAVVINAVAKDAIYTAVRADESENFFGSVITLK